MSTKLVGNALVLQLGKTAPVANSILVGLLSEALNNCEIIEEIYGGIHGWEALLGSPWIDLAEQTNQNVRCLRTSLGYALGGGSINLDKVLTSPTAIPLLKERNIAYLFCISDAETLPEISKLVEWLAKESLKIQVVVVPHSISNQLLETDHSLGYGSFLKALAIQTKSIELEVNSYANKDTVALIEVPGVSTGWLAMSGSLCRQMGIGEPESSFLSLFPEKAFFPESFLAQIQTCLEKHKAVYVLFPSGIVDQDRNYLSYDSQNNKITSSSYVGEAGIAIQQLLSYVLRLKTYLFNLSVPALSDPMLASKTDNSEAFLCGQYAMKSAIEGAHGKAIILYREELGGYQIKPSVVPLKALTQGKKAFPVSWIQENSFGVNSACLRYAQPLIQGNMDCLDENGLPKMGSLRA